jgi:hypothetical protein
MSGVIGRKARWQVGAVRHITRQGHVFWKGEFHMIRQAALATVAMAAIVIAAPSAKAATLAECAKEWSQLKEDGKTDGMTYRDFSSKCMKRDAGETAAADEEEAPKKKKAEAKPKKAKQVVEVEDEDDGASSTGALKKECDAKWKVHKASSGASGWKAYFTYMSKCM